MHCYFILAVDVNIPILYHVQRVRDGRSFATREVHAKQKGNCVFTTIMSFVTESSGGNKVLEHAAPRAAVVDGPPPEARNLDSSVEAALLFERRITVCNNGDHTSDCFVSMF